MADGEELEFKRKECEAAIGGRTRVMLAESAEPRCWVRVAFQYSIHFVDAAAHPQLEKRKKNVLFALEMGVERAARVTGQRGNLRQARRFESVAREDLLCGREQLAASSSRAYLLARGGRRGARPLV